MKIRTGYSFKTAYGKTDEVISRLKEIGEEVAPVCDRLSTFSFVQWTKAANREGLRPIYGVELPVVPALGQKKPPTDYWAFFAKDDISDLHAVVSAATPSSAHHPELLYSEALEAKGVIKVAGERCLLDQLGDVWPSDFYLSLSPSTPYGLYRDAKNRGIPFLATNDNYYPRCDDLEIYRLALGRRSGTQTYARHILAKAELEIYLRGRGFEVEDIVSGFANRSEAIQACQAQLRKATLLVPQKPQTLWEMCKEGAMRNGIDLTNPTYRDRLKRELDLIKEKEFEDYFYILADILSYAKRRMVVGPARGSSCGSLVCYLLGITEVDPIPYGLIFERFIDINRKDLPDVDVDFPSDEKRDLVFEYVERKFGRERVARLGSVNTFKGKKALKQCAQPLRVPQYLIEKVAETINARPGDTDLVGAAFDSIPGAELLRDYPEMLVARRLEDHPDSAGQHAAGLLLTDKPVSQYVAVNGITKAVWCDKHDAEELNLLKIDALGVKQLSVFERALEAIGEKGVSGFLEKLPLDDPRPYEVINQRKYTGVFQFTGQALRGLAKQITIENIEDLAALNALARPGPLAFAETWIRRKNGHEAVKTLHPLLTEITKETQGIILYQETVMQICRQMGDMTWEDTSAVRKIIGKKLGPQALAAYWPKFKEGAIRNGVPEDVAKQIWDQIPAFGIYAFNKSHAVAYAIVAYWSLWFKAYHPVEFAAATLDFEDDPVKQIPILRELANEGISYIPLCPHRSIDRWTKHVQDDGTPILVGPLTTLKSVGPAAVREVLDCRATGKPVRAVIQKRITSAKTSIDSLYPIRDAVKTLHPDLSAINIFSEPIDISSIQCGIRHEIMVFAVIKRAYIKDENSDEAVAKRGGKRYQGPIEAVNMFVADDTDEIFAKIDRYDFERLGKPLLEKVKQGSSLYAIKGTCPSGFRMISIKQVRYLGEYDA